jgi:hypothetical protein
MSAKQRVNLNARVAPADYEAIRSRAEQESRSIGETLALILRERELLEKALESATAEAK